MATHYVFRSLAETEYDKNKIKEKMSEIDRLNINEVKDELPFEKLLRIIKNQRTSKGTLSTIREFIRNLEEIFPNILQIKINWDILKHQKRNSDITDLIKKYQ